MLYMCVQIFVCVSVCVVYKPRIILNQSGEKSSGQLELGEGNERQVRSLTSVRGLEG